MAGEHEDAVARVGDLIATVRPNTIYCVVQVRASHAATQRTPPLTFQ